MLEYPIIYELNMLINVHRHIHIKIYIMIYLMRSQSMHATLLQRLLMAFHISVELNNHVHFHFRIAGICVST